MRHFLHVDLLYEFDKKKKNELEEEINIDDIEETLSSLNNLKRKYGPSLVDVKKYLKENLDLAREIEDKIKLKLNQNNIKLDVEVDEDSED